MFWEALNGCVGAVAHGGDWLGRALSCDGALPGLDVLHTASAMVGRVSWQLYRKLSSVHGAIGKMTRGCIFHCGSVHYCALAFRFAVRVRSRVSSRREALGIVEFKMYRIHNSR